MTLFILATCIVMVVQGQVTGGSAGKDYNTETVNLVDKQLQGKEHDCAINVYQAFKSGMSLTDIADTVIPQCGFTADEIDTWVAKVEKISATVTGEAVPERHTMSETEVAQVTGIDPNELAAEKQNAAAMMAVVGPSAPETGGPDPAPSGTFDIQVDNSASGPHGLFTMLH